MQASVNERELVLDMLLQITRDGEYSHIVIKNVLDKYQYLDKRERSIYYKSSKWNTGAYD